MKICKVCSVAKLNEEFCVDSRNRDGRTGHCKLCQQKRTQKWKKENPAEAKESARRTFNVIKETEAYKEMHKVHSAAYRVRHPGRASQSKREYRLRNPHVDSSSRLARRRAVPTWMDKEGVKAMYLKRDELTAATGIKHHVDHIVPIQSDLVCGLHWEGNMEVIPAIANIVKSNKVWPDMWN